MQFKYTHKLSLFLTHTHRHHLLYTDSKCRQQMPTFNAIQTATKTDICYYIPTSTAIQLATKRTHNSTTRPTQERESARLIICACSRRIARVLPLAHTPTRAASRTHGDIHSLA